MGEGTANLLSIVPRLLQPLLLYSAATALHRSCFVTPTLKVCVLTLDFAQKATLGSVDVLTVTCAHETCKCAKPARNCGCTQKLLQLLSNELWHLH